MTITNYGFNTSSQAAQIYNNIMSGSKSLVNEVESVDKVIENQPLKSDSVTIQSDQQNVNVGNISKNAIENPTYSNLELQTKGELQTLSNKLENKETISTETLQNQRNQTEPPPPEIETPPVETNGSNESLKNETNLENSPNIKTVIPIATNETNRMNAPQVQVTTAGVYTNNPGVAIQASLSVPFTVDQTV